MPNENLKNMLALSKKIEESSVSKRSSNITAIPRIATKAQLDEQINIWDEEVFGKAKPIAGYDPHEEMKKIQERKNKNIEKELSNPILQEVFNNPYDMNLDEISGLSDPRRIELDEKIKKTYKGIASALKINETIAKKDAEKIEEQKKQNTNSYVNYDILQEIIENIIDKKFNEFKNSMLTENINTHSPNKTTMIMLEDNFTFVDSEGNMYKCSGLKHVGKAKIKKN